MSTVSRYRFKFLDGEKVWSAGTQSTTDDAEEIIKYAAKRTHAKIDQNCVKNGNRSMVVRCTSSASATAFMMGIEAVQQFQVP